MKKKDPRSCRQKKSKFFLITFYLLFNFSFLFFSTKVRAAVDSNLIHKQVEQTVEARKSSDAEAMEDKKASEKREGLLVEIEKQVEIKYSCLGGKIQIRKINGQWYLSLSSKF